MIKNKLTKQTLDPENLYNFTPKKSGNYGQFELKHANLTQFPGLKYEIDSTGVRAKAGKTPPAAPTSQVPHSHPPYIALWTPKTCTSFN